MISSGIFAVVSGLLALVSPVGVVVDQVVADNFRSRLHRVEQLQVRIDNAPSYQVAQGRVDRLRLASRGAWLIPELRLDTLELETDPINLDISRLSGNLSGNLSGATETPSLASSLLPPGLLQTPLGAGIRVVVTETDIQQALQSPRVQSLIKEIASGFLGSEAATIEIIPQIKFLPEHRFQLQIDLQTPNNPPIKIDLISGITVLDGSQFNLESPVLMINDSPLPSSVITGISRVFLDRFDLKNLESNGITLRLLQLQINPDQVEIAAFVSIK
ncbi:MAG: DUF2993 domain-containing protein [Coleofasciculaceae cyanobacterium SM2_1_6]|nr:DUF2993 domain-containing protein [Coleofasciculaceae cyanobacterium SM2_1_6]